MNTKPKLVIMVGPPGSGKTYIAAQFASKNRFVHVNSDLVRAKYFLNPQFTSEERARVYVKIQEVISEQLAQGHNVVFDGNLLTSDARFEALEHYQKLGADVLFVHLDIPREVAIQRALSRTTSRDGLYNAMPEERATRMHDTFERLDPSLPQVVITSTDEYDVVDAQVLNALRNMPQSEAP